jgi:D-alanyl-D-alanine carboxypeptidase/D-alanyl-D-alanine-endopeptidase (penicillin-binding protein 4)
MNFFIYLIRQREFLTRSLNLLQPGPFVNKWRFRRALKSRFPSVLLLLPLLTQVILLSLPARTWAEGAQPAGLSRLASHGAVLLSREDELLVSLNPDQPLVPASIVKLVTALAALESLGPDYRFRTEIYQDDSNNLYLKGYGDPFLVSEEIGPLLQELKETGVAAINSIFIDDSAFNLEEGMDGLSASLNPYDVSPGALVVNFNTVNLAVTANGRVGSAEPQTPLLPLMTSLGQKLAPGEHRINITADPANAILLSGQLFRAFQRQVGIPGDGDYGIRSTPAGARLLKTHRSDRDLLELVRILLLYSNNFTANQIYLALGAEKHGYPATWGKSRRALWEFLARDPLLAEGIVMVEGSGLSRRNRVTARALLRVLELFQSRAQLLPVKDGLFLKSGTMTGVYSYAGYRPGPKGLDRLVVILNQTDNNRDKIIKLLMKNF